MFTRPGFTPDFPAITIDRGGKLVLLLFIQVRQIARIDAVDFPTLPALEIDRQNRTRIEFEQASGNFFQRRKRHLTEKYFDRQRFGIGLAAFFQMFTEIFVQIVIVEAVIVMIGQVVDTSDRRYHSLAPGFGQQ